MDEKERRVVEARMKLRERWRAKTLATRALADPAPRGTGPANRHGMPKLPPGQKKTDKWPVLDLGRQPAIPLEEWGLTLDGACRNPQKLDWEAFQALPQVEDESDFHCVTGWSKLDMKWLGVRLSDLAELAEVTDLATHVVCHGYDGYTTNLPLEEALKSDVLLAYSADGQPLSKEHGGPVRMVTPQLYAWKGTKWICRLEFVEGDKLGFWERNGYSNTAHPWQEDRYSNPEMVSRGELFSPALKAIFQWLGGLLLVSCLLILSAQRAGHREWVPAIQWSSYVLAFGAVPYARFRLSLRS
ncbi:sulfite oxidase-like oxidoreductase [bacterium]|nr:sulfite oxidase-like oxidoreductase [bacterium]